MPLKNHLLCTEICVIDLPSAPVYLFILGYIINGTVRGRGDFVAPQERIRSDALPANVGGRST